MHVLTDSFIFYHTFPSSCLSCQPSIYRDGTWQMETESPKLIPKSQYNFKYSYGPYFRAIDWKGPLEMLVCERIVS
jgi:hypothetical protein